MSRVAIALSVGLAAPLAGQTATPAIETGKGLDPVNVTVAPADYRGRSAVRIQELASRGERGHGHAFALLGGTAFREGTIEVDVAGALGPGAVADDRGFIGIAFHVQPGEERFKLFYIRPTNGRADDQLRRNHATQYTAEPEWPWHRLRREEPGRYEAYADLEAAAWTSLRIVVKGSRAELYVGGAAQPTLVVTDMKHGDTGGGVGLWIGRGTDGYFANLRISGS
ncbi:MAG: hypothetical protein R2909_01475 [Gemmatimonadales bacterium]